MSLLGNLRAATLAVETPADPWLAPLQRVQGKVEFDGLERVSSQTLLDVLEVPQRSRTAGTYRRLAKLMAALGWTALRVRDLTRGGFKEQVSGYARSARAVQCTVQSPVDDGCGKTRRCVPTAIVVLQQCIYEQHNIIERRFRDATS